MFSGFFSEKQNRFSKDVYTDDKLLLHRTQASGKHSESNIYKKKEKMAIHPGRST
jgi:hypothetical protein